MRLIMLTLVVMFTGACGLLFGETPSPQLFTPDSEVNVTGTIIGTIDDCAFDGNCALVLDVEGEEVNIIWAEGMLRCEGEYENGLNIGDPVNAFGLARDTNSLSICPSSDYYVRGS